MPVPKPWRSSLWRKALQVDTDHAELEGLAAGTGLLTGDLTRASAAAEAPCPRCGGPGEVTAVDLVASSTHRRCRDCAHSWATVDIEATSLEH